VYNPTNGWELSHRNNKPRLNNLRRCKMLDRLVRDSNLCGVGGGEKGKEPRLNSAVHRSCSLLNCSSVGSILLPALIEKFERVSSLFDVVQFASKLVGP